MTELKATVLERTISRDLIDTDDDDERCQVASDAHLLCELIVVALTRQSVLVVGAGLMLTRLFGQCFPFLIL